MPLSTELSINHRRGPVDTPLHHSWQNSQMFKVKTLPSTGDQCLPSFPTVDSFEVNHRPYTTFWLDLVIRLNKQRRVNELSFAEGSRLLRLEIGCLRIGLFTVALLS